MSEKQQLKEYLKENGKGENSWYDLAVMFNLMPNGNREQRSEAARSCGRLVKKSLSSNEEPEIGKLKSMWQNAGGKWLKSYKFDESENEARLLAIKEEFIREAKAHAPIYKPIEYRNDVVDGERLLEISIFDHHFSKLCWAPETDENYDIDIATIRFKEAIYNFLDVARNLAVDKILLVIGNDLFNTDGASNATTAGTPQDVDVRWQKAFSIVRKLLIECIDNLRTVCPVDIIVVPGNHDRAQCFYLGEALECWYHNCAEVNVNNTPKLRKYYRFGKTLLGFTHGNEEKIADLPMIMAVEASKDFSECTTREFHIGHWHKNQVQEQFGIVTRILPSLTSTDFWHKSKGYVGNMKAAQAYLYSKEKGLVSYFQYSI